MDSRYISAVLNGKDAGHPGWVSLTIVLKRHKAAKLSSYTSGHITKSDVIGSGPGYIYCLFHNLIAQCTDHPPNQEGVQRQVLF